MTNSVDPSQMAFGEAILSRSTLFARQDILGLSRIRVNSMEIQQILEDKLKYCGAS